MHCGLTQRMHSLCHCIYNVQTICSNADKQLEVEQKLAHISSRWETAMFEFQTPVGKKVPLLELGPAVIEDLEVVLQLQSLELSQLAVWSHKLLILVQAVANCSNHWRHNMCRMCVACTAQLACNLQRRHQHWMRSVAFTNTDTTFTYIVATAMQ
jgi:hypothetical protein